MKLDEQLRVILGTPSAVPSPVPVSRGARRMLARVRGAGRALWAQSSWSVAAEVAMGVSLVMLLSRPPATRSWAATPPAETVLVRTDGGALYAVPTDVDATTGPVQVHRAPGAARMLLEEAGSGDIVSIDPLSGWLASHMTSPLVSRLLPGSPTGRPFGTGSQGTVLFEIRPSTLQLLPVFQSGLDIGDVAVAGDGQHAWLSFPTEDRLAMLNRDHRLGRSLTVEGGPELLSMQRGGTELWVACQQTHDVKVVRLLEADQCAVAATVVCPDDGVVALVSGLDHLYRIGGRSVTAIPTWRPQERRIVACPARQPVGWVFAPRNQALVLVARVPAEVEVIDAVAPDHVRTWPLPDAPAGVWLAP